MAQLILKNMEFYAHHGHYSEEQIIGGRFSVDLLIETDTRQAAISDDMVDAVDYSLVYEQIKKAMATPSKLLEHLAKRILDGVYTTSDKIDKVTVTVSKLDPPVGGKMDRFSVVMTR
jgi:dihydroneopterin aldolase